MNKQQLLEEFLEISLKIKKIINMQSELSTEQHIATFLQFQTLSYLSKNPKATPSKLSETLVMSPSSIAQLIDRLTSSGWIARETGEQDKRIVHLSLTLSGKEKLEELTKLRREKFEKLTKTLTQQELEDLNRILRKIYNTFDKSNDRKEQHAEN